MQIFKDENAQKQFDEDGFLKIVLLTDKNIEELNYLFKHYFPNPSIDFYSSSYDNNLELKKEISDAIGKIVTPNLERIFINYTWFGSAFLSKGNGPRSEMPMHQDWTIVDETQFVALNIWTPLQNTTDENGTLQVIKGSHKWHNVVRAPTLPFYFNGYQDLLKEKLISISTQAKEAIVLNQAIIHASKANLTNKTRIAITTGIKSKDAKMIFHYWDKEKPNVIEKFSQENDFLIRFTDFHQSIFLRPTLGTSLGLMPFNKQLVGIEEVNNFVGIVKSNSNKKSFAQKILQWIKL
jgi:hypothetical protein